MNAFSHVPPGFRFHPTDEEFFDYYLRKKIASKKIDLDVIKDVDLYRIEPWDMQDKATYSRHSLIGMRKTLVFYKGRALVGQKFEWIMHEYRLETNETGTPQEEGWVICRVSRSGRRRCEKWMNTSLRVGTTARSRSWRKSISPRQIPLPNASYYHHYPCKQELKLQYNLPHNPFLRLPLLDNPNVQQAAHGNYDGKTGSTL
ncbi:hypothetical protein V6N11_081880 [Hibiscus sabdariffa]|uniref:NAC domain-containing protein n=1 Tax=Hibiscus sabdariffa TaxID=183260 RepID=A0ABR2Q7G6_9ROSI